MTQILDGKAMAKTLRAEAADEVRTMLERGARAPGLAVILVGEDPASQVYVRSKGKAAEEAGFYQQTITLPATTSEDELLAQIDTLNNDDRVDGILVQLPLPDGLSDRRAIEQIDPEKDVDGLHPMNAGRLWLDRNGLTPATPTGVIELLKRSGIELQGKRAVVVGRSPLVGKPMAALLLREQCTVTVCHSRTRDLPGVCREAEILVAAVGRPAMVDADYVSEGTVVIDVGIHRLADRAEVERLFPGNEKRLAAVEKRGATLIGDVNYTQVAPRAAAITPVPGGVGPLTVATLITNTVKAAKRRQGIAG